MVATECQKDSFKIILTFNTETLVSADWLLRRGVDDVTPDLCPIISGRDLYLCPCPGHHTFVSYCNGQLFLTLVHPGKKDCIGTYKTSGGGIPPSDTQTAFMVSPAATSAPSAVSSTSTTGQPGRSGEKGKEEIIFGISYTSV
ncbi:uncharacterized protein LOC125046001 [Penaeus chinensis]|uniref:uncharacterized protein LOC125046001 n=1 Tax=Penaeus chinensis TaxID=139456 RepID=UPI001FB827EE|nr:uncharacterized protein LOC125046001 [Penaeus chinensis]